MKSWPYIIRLLALLSVSACQPALDDALKQSGIIYCSEGSPLIFNPQLDASGTTADATAHQLYDRLIDFDPQTKQMVPRLASSWKISDDGRVYTFQLRKGVSFHSTSYFTPSRHFNADDVLFSFNRWRKSSHPFHLVSGGNYPYFDSLGLAGLIADIKRINGYRVEIYLTRPDSSFMANLATDFAVILSAEYANQLLIKGQQQRIDTHPVGTGPFVFADYRKNDFIRYRKHDAYWHHQQAPEQLIFDITESSSLRLAKLMTGECDVIAYPAHSELEVIRQRDDLILDEIPGLNVGFWAFNTQKAPFNDVRVRKALSMAIDKNTLIEAVYFDSAVPAHSVIPPASWAYENKASSNNYNPAEARRLLRQAGVPADFSMDIWAMPVQRVYNPNARKMAEIIQRDLAQVGITANIVSFEWSTFRERLAAGEHDTVLIGWTADNGDPDNFYRPLLSCDAIASGTNRAMWCNSGYDEVIDEALSFTDTELRSAYYHLANAIITDQLPVVPIAHAYQYQVRRADISGLQINPYGGMRFGEVKKRP